MAKFRNSRAHSVEANVIPGKQHTMGQTSRNQAPHNRGGTQKQSEAGDEVLKVEVDKAHKAFDEPDPQVVAYLCSVSGTIQLNRDSGAEVDPLAVIWSEIAKHEAQLSCFIDTSHTMEKLLATANPEELKQYGQALTGDVGGMIVSDSLGAHVVEVWIARCGEELVDGSYENTDLIDAVVVFANGLLLKLPELLDTPGASRVLGSLLLVLQGGLVELRADGKGKSSIKEYLAKRQRSKRRARDHAGISTPHPFGTTLRRFVDNLGPMRAEWLMEPSLIYCLNALLTARAHLALPIEDHWMQNAKEYATSPTASRVLQTYVRVAKEAELLRLWKALKKSFKRLIKDHNGRYVLKDLLASYPEGESWKVVLGKVLPYFQTLYDDGQLALISACCSSCLRLGQPMNEIWSSVLRVSGFSSPKDNEFLAPALLASLQINKFKEMSAELSGKEWPEPTQHGCELVRVLLKIPGHSTAVARSLGRSCAEYIEKLAKNTSSAVILEYMFSGDCPVTSSVKQQLAKTVGSLITELIFHPSGSFVVEKSWRHISERNQIKAVRELHRLRNRVMNHTGACLVWKRLNLDGLLDATASFQRRNGAQETWQRGKKRKWEE